MLINFALDVVGTKVTSDKVSTDGHECSNLISNNWHLRRKGFLAEYFIKPPVSLTFEFPCNVCIHHVFVTPCVGQQLSSQIELYSTSKLSRTKTAQKLETVVSGSGTAALTEKCGISNAPVASHSLAALFYPISKMYVTDYNRVCFYNPAVSALCHSETVNDIASYHQRAEIRHFRQEIINASSHLTLRIARTTRGSTAAVSSIDIWGSPALSVPTAIRDDILNKYITFINQSSIVKGSEISEHENKDCVTATSSCVADELEVPEDFLDSITCEVMAIPMLLPSGKNVDLSTLDHYFNVEASYGRQPRDPFTGIQFSTAIKPIPNGALKARIDKFLMEHCDNAATSTIARTVSGNRNISLLGKRKRSGNTHAGVSSLITKNVDRQSLDTTHHNQAEVSNHDVSKLRDSAVKGSQLSKNRPLPNSIHDMDEITCTGLLQQDQQIASSCNSNNNGSSGHSHETKLKCSLNNALSSILSGLPSYLSTSQIPSVSELCSVCKRMLSADKASYVTPCHHYVCRDCLTSDSDKSTMTCGACGNLFFTNDVLRRHQAV